MEALKSFPQFEMKWHAYKQVNTNRTFCRNVVKHLIQKIFHNDRPFQAIQDQELF